MLCCLANESYDLASAVQARLQTAEREDLRRSQILQFLHYHPLSSRDEIAKGTAYEGSDATLKQIFINQFEFAVREYFWENYNIRYR